MTILTEVCRRASLSYCYTLFIDPGVSNFSELPECYSRSFTLLNSFVSQPGSLLVNILTFVVIIIILFSIKNKYTAVGRSEICFLFYNFLIFIVISIIVDNGFIGKSSENYSLFLSLQMASISVCSASLALTGLLNLKLWEDNTWFSMAAFQLGSIAVGSSSFICHYQTFKKDKMGFLNAKMTTILLTDYFINAVFIAMYVICQCLTSIFIVKNYWMIGAQALGLMSFLTGQIITHFFSSTICQQSNHYIDGMFAMTLSNLLSFMMVYKSWAISTAEDLEFGVNMISEDKTLDQSSDKI